MSANPSNTGMANGAASTDSHVLQLHEGEKALGCEISRVLCVALDQGFAAVSIARPRMLDLITSDLQHRGVDVAAAREQQRYVTVDAATMLSRFVRRGKVDDRLFGEVVSELFDPLCARVKTVSVFGEMVALLWEGGQHEAALRLEQLWTDFLRERPVVLYCSYPSSAATDPGYGEVFRAICAEHCRVLHAASPLAKAG
jgi:hypothetical protein